MLKNIFLYPSFLLVSWLSLLLIVSNLSFLLGFDLNLLNLTISLLITLFVLFFIIKNNRDFIVSLGVASIVVLISYALATNFYDISYDGQGYHQETIYLLKNGWNPVHEEAHPFRSWVNHYQKGNEIMQANIYLLTNQIESVKAIGLILMYVAFSLSFSFLNLLPMKRIYQLLIAVVVVFNPVVFTQVFTNYIDANWYLTLVISISSLLIYFANRERIALIVFILSSVIFCSLKLTSIPVFIVISVFVFSYHLFFYKKKMLMPFLMIFIFSVLCNIHPFITNVQKGYHFLHPFAGDQKTDILNQNIPKVLLNHNRIERILISLFSKPNNDRAITLNDTLKIPFSFDKSQLFLIYDTRLSGFGFWFSGLLVITSLLMIYLLVTKNNGINKKTFLWVVFALFCTILINPAAWWARLSPQIWLFPVVIIVFGLLAKNRLPKALSQICLFIFLLNLSLPAFLTYLDLRANQKTMEKFVDSVADKTITLDISNSFGFQQYYLKFKEKNIKYKIGKTKEKSQIAPFTKDVYYELE